MMVGAKSLDTAAWWNIKYMWVDCYVCWGGQLVGVGPHETLTVHLDVTDAHDQG